MALTTTPLIWYAKAPKNLSLRDLVTEDIKIALCTSAYTPNTATHEFFDTDITNQVANGNGYTTGGISLTSKTLNFTSPNWIFSSANPQWTPSGTSLTAKYCVLYNNTPVSNKPLIAFGYLDYNGGAPLDVTSAVGVPLILLVPSTGWVYTEEVNGV